MSVPPTVTTTSSLIQRTGGGGGIDGIRVIGGGSGPRMGTETGDVAGGGVGLDGTGMGRVLACTLVLETTVRAFGIAVGAAFEVARGVERTPDTRRISHKTTPKMTATQKAGPIVYFPLNAQRAILHAHAGPAVACGCFGRSASEEARRSSDA